MKCLKSFLALLAVTATIAMPTGQVIASESGIDDEKIIVTDFRGRPPFSRSRISAPADLARFEEVGETDSADSAAETTTVRVTDFRGRPPFRRHTVDATDSPVADLARFEEIAQEKSRRTGPPGKYPHRR